MHFAMADLACGGDRMQDLTPQRPGETVLRLKTLSARVDRRAMRRLAFVGLLLLVGCQSEDHAYDAEAKAQARAVAPSVATYGRLVSVGRAVEREALTVIASSYEYHGGFRLKTLSA